jgi:hypothetical protein
VAAQAREVAAEAPDTAFVGRLLSQNGQAFLDTCRLVLDKPANQDVVNTMLDVIAGYFRPLRPEGPPDMTLGELAAEARSYVAGLPPSLRPIAEACPEVVALLGSARVLSGLSYGVVRPIFGDSTAIGSLMRRKLEPVFTPLLGHIDLLRGGRR